MSERNGGVGRWDDEEARSRRRTREQPTGPRESGGSDSGGGRLDTADALLAAAMRAPIARGGMTNSGWLAMASLHGHLRRRRLQSSGEAFFPETHVAGSPALVQAALHLARGADPAAAAAALPGADTRQVREARDRLDFATMAKALERDLVSGNLERTAHAALQEKGIDPGTPPEQSWRRALDGSDLGRLRPRDLGALYLSAAEATGPQARQAEARVLEALAERHPQLAASVERGLVQDRAFAGDPHSARLDKNTAVAGAVWSADERPVPMEEWLVRAVPRFKDARTDPNWRRDAAESVITAALDGRAPAGSVPALIDNARRSLPGFDARYREGLALAEERTRAGTGSGFPQGDAVLYALDRGRDFPVNEARQGRGAVVAAGNGDAARLRAGAGADAPDRRPELADARLPKNRGQAERAVEANGRAVARTPATRLDRAQQGNLDERRDRNRQRVQQAREQRAAYRAGRTDAVRRDGVGLPRTRVQANAAVRRATVVHRRQRNELSTLTRRSAAGR
ncbi:hypothetical protein ACOQFV_04890 [Nocardiopsis changdeensis]|uniref:DUF222 domain-containing protein n=1 Tax=Nocardiopsis changdeensis TaxID=2831969 RepID=A0ABX8BNL5_9ACTN|nr:MULTISPECIES: hypothetical protein [Nocardiopsis]QUX23223.1 hypothetical protein KGD84_02145 [Nocardiopsis changdeensis]QYX39165.1 hypothetical protein K1J57_11595 [Nocardiopsis sp. MT53]